MKVLNFANVAGKIRGGGVHEVVYSFFRIQNTLNIDAHLWFPGYVSEEEELQSDLQNLMPVYTQSSVRGSQR